MSNMSTTAKIISCFCFGSITKNINLLQIKCNLAVPLNSSTKRKLHLLNRSRISPFGWTILLIPVTTFGLGCWQVKRKIWKENLIKEIEENFSRPASPIPDNLDDLALMEYKKINVKGYFLHNLELYLGPRTLINPNESQKPGGLLSKRNESIGYHVITPFKLSGRDETILVNRGWVPRSQLKPEKRQEGQKKDEIEICAVVRSGEARPIFSPKQKGNIFLYKDLNKMCEITGSFPALVDATYESTIPGGPIGGQTKVQLRNDHLSYIITWYGLSAGTFFMWYRTILLRKPF